MVQVSRSNIRGRATGVSPRTLKLRSASIEARVGAHIKPQPNGCWLWNGRRDRYGQVEIWAFNERITVQAHRYIYEILVGPIPDRHELHHTCETPSCCNPAHLKPLTSKAHKAAHRLLRL